MTNHYDEEAQVEQLRRWWKENWTSLAAGLAIGLGAILGWEQWQAHQHARAANASRMYEELKNAITANKVEEAAALGDKLVADFPSSPYAADGALRLAAKAVSDGKLDDAAARLAWVLDHADDPAMQPLVRLRLARVQWQQNKVDDALKTLDGDAGPYGALYDELRGDIKLAQGDRAAAAAAYRKALDASAAEPSKDRRAGLDREGLQRKLDDLADVAGGAAPAEAKS